MLTLRAVLFDLDGTLLDTAPDMVGALNDMLRADSRQPVDYTPARAHVSNGAFALVDIGYPNSAEDDRLVLRDRFLDAYAERIAHETTFFPGMDEVLIALEQARTPWGIVTNKPSALTDALLHALEIQHRCACIVSGDTLKRRKPHPDPLLHAARSIGIQSSDAMYVGDATRDIEAGKAAGMLTVGAAYGYVAPGETADDWNADFTIDAPEDLHPLLKDLGAITG